MHVIYVRIIIAIIKEQALYRNSVTALCQCWHNGHKQRVNHHHISSTLEEVTD